MVLLVLAVAAVLPALAVATAGTSVAATVAYRPPVPGEVWRPFERPDSAFAAGHRGVDLAAFPGDPVRVAAAGIVRHAGPVAGMGWVAVEHADGIVTTYGPLTALTVRAGQVLSAGDLLGRLAAGGHGHGGRDVGLHWGARRGDVYLDPLSLLEPGPPRPSLVGPGRLLAPAHRTPRRGPGGARPAILRGAGPSLRWARLSRHPPAT